MTDKRARRGLVFSQEGIMLMFAASLVLFKVEAGDPADEYDSDWPSIEDQPVPVFPQSVSKHGWHTTNGESRLGVDVEKFQDQSNLCILVSTAVQPPS